MHIQLYIILGKVTALGVLCCFALFVCLTLLASFFLPSHLQLKTYTYTHDMLCTYICKHHGNTNSHMLIQVCNNTFSQSIV